MFWYSQAEKKIDRRIKELLGPSTDIDSPAGVKAQSQFLILQSLRSGRMVRYTLWSVIILALAFIADLIIRIIQLAK